MSVPALPWMIPAIAARGLTEIPGARSNPKILQWARILDLQSTYTTDSIPWCGLFVAYCIAYAGSDISESPLWALSWAKWGVAVTPSYGAILSFRRDGGGHVCFYLSEDDDYYHVLGGNQSDSVNITKIAKSRLAGSRWPTEFQNLYSPGIRVRLGEVGGAGASLV